MTEGSDARAAAGGAPKRLVVLMEGESLFNDATSIVLFEIFFRMVKRLGKGKAGSTLGPWAQAADILANIFTLAGGLVLPVLAAGGKHVCCVTIAPLAEGLIIRCLLQ